MKIRFILFLFTIIALACNSQAPERNIVLINIDTLDRRGIAKEISIINSFNPKVIALDVKFINDTQFSIDQLLANELSKCKNLIMARTIGNYTGTENEYWSFVEESEPWFLINAKTGFTNYLPETDRFHTLKRFSTSEKVKGNIEYHFGVRTAMAFDSLKALRFVENNPRVIDVDYNDGKRKFKTLSSNNVLKKRITRDDIEGKIVMIGFLGPGDEDKFFTPLNKKTTPLKPDMYGVEYLANIVAQVLEYK